MTRPNVGKHGWVFPLFSPYSDDRLSLNVHRFVILYISRDTRSVGIGQYCLPKVYNGFGIVVTHCKRNYRLACAARQSFGARRFSNSSNVVGRKNVQTIVLRRESFLNHPQLQCFTPSQVLWKCILGVPIYELEYLYYSMLYLVI